MFKETLDQVVYFELKDLKTKDIQSIGFSLRYWKSVSSEQAIFIPEAQSDSIPYSVV